MDRKQHTTKTTQTKNVQDRLIPLIEKENLTDNINLSGPPDTDRKYTIHQVFNLHDPLDNIPLSKLEIEKIFLPNTEKLTIELLQKYQNFDPVFRQLKSWHTYKTKPMKAEITILGNKTLLRRFRKFNNTSINQKTNISEYQTSELKVPCLPLSMILLAFHISHSLNAKNKLQKNKISKDKIYISIIESHLTQKDQFHHPQKETHI